MLTKVQCWCKRKTSEIYRLQEKFLSALRRRGENLGSIFPGNSIFVFRWPAHIFQFTFKHLGSRNYKDWLQFLSQIDTKTLFWFSSYFVQLLRRLQEMRLLFASPTFKWELISRRQIWGFWMLQQCYSKIISLPCHGLVWMWANCLNHIIKSIKLINFTGFSLS